VYNYFIMSTYDFSATGVKYPLENSPVNVHGDFKKLAESLDAILPKYGVSYFEINVNIPSSPIDDGVPVYVTGSNGGRVNVAKALPGTTAPILGLFRNSTNPNPQFHIVVVAGVMDNLNTSMFFAGDTLYVGESGGLTKVRPAGGSAAVGICAVAHINSGIVIVEAKGNGTWGALRDGLS
jgi:hypothetical protein